MLTFPEWPYKKKVFVLSNTIKELPDSLREKASILSMKPKELIKYLSGLGFLNVYVDGGKVIQDFLNEDCIEELIITKVPLLIGSGIPLFGHLHNDLKFKHIKTTVYPDGLVKSIYKRIRK